MVDDLSYNKTQVFYQRATLVKEICEKYNLTQAYISQNTLEQNLLLNLEHKVFYLSNLKVQCEMFYTIWYILDKEL